VIEIYVAGIGILDVFVSCDIDLDPMTFIWTWPVLPEAKQDVQIWTSYVKAFESYRLTDRQTDWLTERQKDRQKDTESTEITIKSSIIN